MTEQTTIQRETVVEDAPKPAGTVTTEIVSTTHHPDEEAGGAVAGGVAGAVVGAVVGGPVGAVVGGAIGAASGATAGAIDEKSKTEEVVITR